MKTFNHHEVELAQVKVMLSLANIALLVAVLYLHLCCVCQCSARTQPCGKPLLKMGLFPPHWSPL